MVKQFRQGEILLTKVTAQYEGVCFSEKNAELVLGHGETGNTHTVIGKDLQWLHQAVDDINAIMQDGARSATRGVYLKAPYGGEIVHRSSDEGHANIELPAGLYRVTIDREQWPWESQARYTQD